MDYFGFIKKAMLLGLYASCSCVFFVLLIAWPRNSMAENFESFSPQKKGSAMRIVGIIDNMPSLPQAGYDEESAKGEMSRQSENQSGKKHVFSDSSAVVDAGEPKLVGDISKLSDNQVRPVQEVLNKNIQSNNGFVSNSLEFSFQSNLSASSYFSSNTGYSRDEYPLFDRLREEVRTDLGEDFYGQMVWAIGEVKEMDRWINSTMNQYGLGARPLFSRYKYDVFDINENLNFQMLFRGNRDAGLFYEMDINENPNGSIEKNGIISTQVPLDNVFNLHVQESKFFIFLKYLSIINIVYAFSVVIFIGMVFNAIKFFIRQKRSVVKVRNANNSWRAY